jgi:sulfur carrier protein ThiS
VKVKVKLFGTLGQNISGYRYSQEIEVEVPHGTTANDLLAHLQISLSQGVTLIAEGKVLGADDVIQDGTLVNVMQAIRGG